MLPQIAQGLISGIGSLLQGGINFGTQKYNIDKTIRANREMAEYQYNKDLEMWNKGNLYNSPLEQMKRLREAGLNPNLVYGTGAQGNTTSQLPKYQAPRQEYNYHPPVDIPSIIGAFQDFQVRSAQIDNLRAQNQVINQNAISGAIKADLLNIERQFKGQNITTKLAQEYEKLWTMEQKRTQQGQIFPFQLQFAEGRNRAQTIAMQKMQADTEFTQKKMDWYLTQLFGKLGIDAFNSVMKTMPTQKATKAVGNLNQKAGRYNSPTWWKNAGY